MPDDQAQRRVVRLNNLLAQEGFLKELRRIVEELQRRTGADLPQHDELHAKSHDAGGGDQPHVLNALARVGVRVAGSDVGRRRFIHFLISGSSTVVGLDDPDNEEVEITFTSPAFAGTGDIADVAATESAGVAGTVPRGDHVHAHQASQHASGGAMVLYSYHQYVFVPDAAVGVAIIAGAIQGPIHHSGPVDETATKLYVDAETAPGASGLPITVKFGDTDDLDTVASYTTIATLTLSSAKTQNTSSMSQATVTANRLVVMDVGTIVGTPKDSTVTLRIKRPLST